MYVVIGVRYRTIEGLTERMRGNKSVMEMLLIMKYKYVNKESFKYYIA